MNRSQASCRRGSRNSFARRTARKRGGSSSWYFSSRSRISSAHSAISEDFATQSLAHAIQPPRPERLIELACRSKMHRKVHRLERGRAIRTTRRRQDSLPFDQHLSRTARPTLASMRGRRPRSPDQTRSSRIQGRLSQSSPNQKPCPAGNEKDRGLDL
jgi:hypothetical protein